jgi:dipeptidase D
MSATEILSLNPKRVWKHFYELTQIPRPTGHMEKVTQFIKDFGEELGLEVEQDKVGNVLIRKPATKGFESTKTVILQSHLDMVPQKNSEVTHDFLNDPIQAYVDGDQVKAKSTTLGADNGIGCAMMMAVLEDKMLNHPAIEALFTIDEEVGMDGANGLEKGFLKGTVMLNLDTEADNELCIGCAGGRDVNITFNFQPDTEIDKDDIAYKISLRGLKGGHSGVQIHLGHANANKLMNRFLKEVVRDYEARLASINGGSLRNAIPRESFVVLTIPSHLEDDLIDLVDEFQTQFREDFAGRMVASPGKKTYGILSVLLQVWYDIEYLFTVNEQAFIPPPKVKSAVVRLTRNNRVKLNCDEKLFKTVVKTSFNQRRKMLRNSIKSLLKEDSSLPEDPILTKRPEQLSIEQFEQLTNLLEPLVN